MPSNFVFSNVKAIDSEAGCVSNTQVQFWVLSSLLEHCLPHFHCQSFLSTFSHFCCNCWKWKRKEKGRREKEKKRKVKERRILIFLFVLFCFVFLKLWLKFWELSVGWRLTSWNDVAASQDSFTGSVSELTDLF